MTTLFDIDCKRRQCWSPNTAKPRYVLALKGIPYTTQWVSYPDIDGLLRHHGQEDAKTVTCPVLRYKETYIVDSFEIAKHLEKEVPHPTIFPGGIARHEEFKRSFERDVKANVFAYIVADIPAILDDRGSEYFIKTRESKMGPLSKISEPGDAAFLPKIKSGMEGVYASLRKHDYVHGNEFSYSDVEVLSILQWIKEADEDKYAKVMALDGEGLLSGWMGRCSEYGKQMD